MDLQSREIQFTPIREEWSQENQAWNTLETKTEKGEEERRREKSREEKRMEGRGEGGREHKGAFILKAFPIHFNYLIMFSRPSRLPLGQTNLWIFIINSLCQLFFCLFVWVYIYYNPHKNTFFFFNLNDTLRQSLILPGREDNWREWIRFKGLKNNLREVKSLTQSQTVWVQILAPPHISCMTGTNSLTSLSK